MRRFWSLIAVSFALLAVPAAAQAVGPATFLKAGGGAYSATLYPGGLKTYSSSPAYITLLDRGATASIEAYAAHHNFAAVAVRDVRGGRAGEDCFVDAHLIMVPSFISGFRIGALEYRGLFMQYAKSFFLRGDRKPRDCTVVRSPGPVIPTLSVAGGSRTLSFACLARTCRGTFSTFGRPSSCRKPVAVPPGHLGCLPAMKGQFVLVGGLSGSFTIKLFKRSPRTTMIAIAVNGKLRTLAQLSSLPRPQVLPPRPRKASISATCAGGTLGGSVAVSGTVRPGGPRVPVTLTFAAPGGTTSTVSTTAAADGRYSARFTPRTAGAWTVTATFDGDRTRRAASSRACSFSVS
jgi:hypothetical protein